LFYCNPVSDSGQAESLKISIGFPNEMSAPPGAPQ